MAYKRIIHVKEHEKRSVHMAEVVIIKDSVEMPIDRAKLSPSFALSMMIHNGIWILFTSYLRLQSVGLAFLNQGFKVDDSLSTIIVFHYAVSYRRKRTTSYMMSRCEWVTNYSYKQCDCIWLAIAAGLLLFTAVRPCSHVRYCIVMEFTGVQNQQY